MNGVARRVGPGRRLLARLSRAMYGPQARIPKPTAEEYRALTSEAEHH